MKPASLLFKTLAVTATVTAISHLPSAPAFGRELVRSNEFEIQNSGNVAKAPIIDLKPGLYDMSDIDSKWSTQYHLLVVKDVNKPDDSFALLFSKDAVDQSRSRAWMYSATPIDMGGTQILAPLFVDTAGRFRDLGKVMDTAPVLEIAYREGRFAYNYTIRGRNGAMGGKLFGMNANSKQPQLRVAPSTGIFTSTSGKSPFNVQVNNRASSLSINGRGTDQTYAYRSLNGSEGGFATLTSSTLRTRRRNETSGEDIQKLATFLSGCFNRETLMVLTPNLQQRGEYTLEAFEITTPGFFEFLFPGNPDPQRDRYSQQPDFMSSGD